MGRKETESKGKTVTVVAYGRLAKMGKSLRKAYDYATM